ncbi:hypothetical protein [Staphylococcus epidermidis]|nr:hypothetical protein [Staphylococcus epidermidis]
MSIEKHLTGVIGLMVATYRLLVLNVVSLNKEYLERLLRFIKSS